LWPLPGGVGHYMETLLWLVEVAQSVPVGTDIVDAMMERYSLSSRKTALSYLRVPHSLGFLELIGDSVYVTDQGNALLKSKDKHLVEAALLQRIEGCRVVIEALTERPRRLGHLIEQMSDMGFEQWSTGSQLRYRLRWLEECGVVERIGTTRPEYKLVDAPVSG
jgi:hypothetical protein